MGPTGNWWSLVISHSRMSVCVCVCVWMMFHTVGRPSPTIKLIAICLAIDRLIQMNSLYVMCMHCWQKVGKNARIGRGWSNEYYCFPRNELPISWRVPGTPTACSALGKEHSSAFWKPRRQCINQLSNRMLRLSLWQYCDCHFIYCTYTSQSVIWCTERYPGPRHTDLWRLIC